MKFTKFVFVALTVFASSAFADSPVLLSFNSGVPVANGYIGIGGSGTLNEVKVLSPVTGNITLATCAVDKVAAQLVYSVSINGAFFDLCTLPAKVKSVTDSSVQIPVNANDEVSVYIIGAKGKKVTHSVNFYITPGTPVVIPPSDNNNSDG